MVINQGRATSPQTLYTMRTTEKLVKAFERFNADLRSFGEETGETFVTLYEDANTTRQVREFKLCKNGKLSWLEMEGNTCTKQTEQMYDEDDGREWLAFWRANLRRAKRYWSMDSDTLDKIQDGEIEDKED